MTMEERVESLKSKHATLEQTLQSETCRPRPNDTMVHELKREKLRIKDEIVRLSVAR
jgi:hypothetical protein